MKQRYRKPINKKNLDCYIVIPAYNEALSISTILRRISYPCLVIDDSSTDTTAAIAKKFKAIVIRHKENSGTGAAIKTGLNFVKKKAKRVIVMDADGQHDPSHIPELIKAIKNTNSDMVIASRYITDTHPATSKARIFGTKMISWWIHVWYRKKIYDPTSGFRIYNKKTVEFLAKKYPTHFPEPESILLLLNHGFRIEEIPVTMNKRLYGSSSISLRKAIRLFLYIIIQTPLSRLGFIKRLHPVNNR